MELRLSTCRGMQLGKGKQGKVVAAVDLKTGESVAVKQVGIICRRPTCHSSELPDASLSQNQPLEYGYSATSS